MKSLQIKPEGFFEAFLNGKLVCTILCLNQLNLPFSKLSNVINPTAP
jgi:hypothetical protein